MKTFESKKNKSFNKISIYKFVYVYKATCKYNKTEQRTLLNNFKAIRCTLSSVLTQSSARMQIYACVNSSGEKQSCITDVVKFISSAASTRVFLCNGALVPKGNSKIGSDA
jgi:hypothetical protein